MGKFGQKTLLNKAFLRFLGVSGVPIFKVRDLPGGAGDGTWWNTYGTTWNTSLPPTCMHACPPVRKNVPRRRNEYLEWSHRRGR